jgi:N-acetylmuramoyl-L-alanine amidase
MSADEKKSKTVIFMVLLILILTACQSSEAVSDLAELKAGEDMLIYESEPIPEPELVTGHDEEIEDVEIAEEMLEEITENDTGVSYVIAIDPGHQGKGNNEQEPIGPGATETKAKVTSGTSGVSTKVPEHQLNLDVSRKLRDELESRGYNVYMIRESADVNISNKERAEAAALANADIFVRIHADGSANSNVQGILVLCPTKNNPYISHLYQRSRDLSDAILTAMTASTGANNRGVREVDNMSGINWAQMPVTIVEMGLMSNPVEDELMQTEEYQWKLARGIADGIDVYFAGNE